MARRARKRVVVRPRRALAVALAVACSLTLPVRAPARVAGPASTVSDATLQSLKGKQVVIVRSDGSEVRGELALVGGESVTVIDASGGVVAIPKSSISSVRRAGQPAPTSPAPTTPAPAPAQPRPTQPEPAPVQPPAEQGWDEPTPAEQPAAAAPTTDAAGPVSPAAPADAAPTPVAPAADAYTQAVTKMRSKGKRMYITGMVFTGVGIAFLIPGTIYSAMQQPFIALGYLIPAVVCTAIGAGLGIPGKRRMTNPHKYVKTPKPQARRFMLVPAVGRSTAAAVARIRF